MEIREMTDKEIIEILNELKIYFSSRLFENNQSVINALEGAVEAIENNEDSKKLNKAPFDRVKERKWYCVIGLNNEIVGEWEYDNTFDDKQYECSNYFNDEDFAKQVALHQLLYRKLLKFKLERETNDIHFESRFSIDIDKDNSPFVNAILDSGRSCNGVYFKEHSTAELALNKVVKPFLKEHPDFIWNL